MVERRRLHLLLDFGHVVEAARYVGTDRVTVGGTDHYIGLRLVSWMLFVGDHTVLAFDSCQLSSSIRALLLVRCEVN